MKKVLLFNFLLASTICLTGCPSTPENKTNSPLIFSELHSASDTESRAIELYNLGDLDINLSEYKLIISNGYTVQLTGIIKPKTTFVVAKEGSKQSFIDKADMVTPNLFYNGLQAVSLKKGDYLCDVFNYPDAAFDCGSYLDLCRKQEYLIGRRNYRQYDWIRYACDDVSRLGNIDAMSDEELLEGPKLTAADFNKPFSASEGVGGGGAIKVTLGSMGDGDTTRFNFGYSDDYVYGNQSVRYLCLDTPETQHGDEISEMPWGVAAKNYNNSILRQAKAYAVSSAPESATRENYGRVLGYVWVSYVDNPRPEDYVCLNHFMVKEGYSTMRFIGKHQKDDKTNYKGISFTNMMYNSELIAIENKIRIHGQEDPNFNYSKNK